MFVKDLRVNVIQLLQQNISSLYDVIYFKVFSSLCKGRQLHCITQLTLNRDEFFLSVKSERSQKRLPCRLLTEWKTWNFIYYKYILLFNSTSAHFRWIYNLFFAALHSFHTRMMITDQIWQIVINADCDLIKQIRIQQWYHWLYAAFLSMSI